MYNPQIPALKKITTKRKTGTLEWGGLADTSKGTNLNFNHVPHDRKR